MEPVVSLSAQSARFISAFRLVELLSFPSLEKYGLLCECDRGWEEIQIFNQVAQILSYMGTGPSTPGIRQITVGEAVQGMPHRTMKSTSGPTSAGLTSPQESNAIMKDGLQISSVHKSSVLSQKNPNGIENIKLGVTGHGDQAYAAHVDDAVVAGGRDEADGLLHGTDKSRETQSVGSDTSVKKDEDDDEEEETGTKPSKKPLTADEIAARKKKYFENCVDKMKLMSTLPPRHLDEEGAPYNKEFRACLLTLAKSYFLLKVGKVPYSDVLEYRHDVGKALFNQGTVQLLCDVLADGLDRKDYVTTEGKMVSAYWLPMKNILLTLLNFSDAREEIRTCITEHPTLVPFMLKLLNERQEAHLKKETTDNQEKLLTWIVCILHNCGSSDENVPRLRELGVIQKMEIKQTRTKVAMFLASLRRCSYIVCHYILPFIFHLQGILPYLDSHLSRVRLATIASLADLVNEEESELLGTHVTIFRFIIVRLEKALKQEDHKDLGWSAEELTRAIGRLARNDANKKILVEKGCLPVLTELLKCGNDVEIKEALNCLWVLSFDEDNKQKMVDEPGLIQLIWDKYLTSEASRKHSCHGILWSLREQLLACEAFKNIGTEIANMKSYASPKTEVAQAVNEGRKSSLGVNFEGHIMISYQWANQEVIKTITQELRAHGIPVWIDIDYMGGSTLQAMAKAVEDAFIVIIAMSQKYKDSPNTRAEAEYAFQQRKKIIPLIMQKNYRPDGWLGLILGSKLYYDFSGKYSFESRMEGLLKAIMTMAKGGPDMTDAGEQPLVLSKAGLSLAPPPNITPMASPKSHQPPPRQRPNIDDQAVKKWTQTDVSQWLSKYNLKRLKEKEECDIVTNHQDLCLCECQYQDNALSQLSGEEIIFMHGLKFEAPEFFYRCLETKLQLTSILELANASKAFSDVTL